MKESINKGILKFEKINQAILKLEDFLWFLDGRCNLLGH